jgi:hypothetical protein
MSAEIKTSQEIVPHFTNVQVDLSGATNAVKVITDIVENKKAICFLKNTAERNTLALRDLTSAIKDLKRSNDYLCGSIESLSDRVNHVSDLSKKSRQLTFCQTINNSFRLLFFPVRNPKKAAEKVLEDYFSGIKVVEG